LSRGGGLLSARQVPREIREDERLNHAIAALPSNYNFEARAAHLTTVPAQPRRQVHKTVWRLRSAQTQVVALQLPEGLLMYACLLADIFQSCVPCPPPQSV
jgi:2-(3-amino-3-carboxypropyl)histidine synthase